jgi:2-hydroxychromene-2-carboxylate isomerase
MWRYAIAIEAGPAQSTLSLPGRATLCAGTRISHLPAKEDLRARASHFMRVCVPRTRDYSAPFADRVFERFWKHELDVEKVESLAAILTEVGATTDQFHSYISDEATEAKQRRKRGLAEADRDQVFGVPTFVVDNERFWGYDRIDWLVKKLDTMDLRR